MIDGKEVINRLIELDPDSVQVHERSECGPWLNGYWMFPNIFTLNSKVLWLLSELEKVYYRHSITVEFTGSQTSATKCIEVRVSVFGIEKVTSDDSYRKNNN